MMFVVTLNSVRAICCQVIKRPSKKIVSQSHGHKLLSRRPKLNKNLKIDATNWILQYYVCRWFMAKAIEKDWVSNWIHKRNIYIFFFLKIQIHFHIASTTYCYCCSVQIFGRTNEIAMESKHETEYSSCWWCCQCSHRIGLQSQGESSML